MKWLAFASLFIAGCAAGSKYAGTYRADSGPEIILNDDGTFRYLIGERTSAQDSSGTYQVKDREILFKGGTRFSRAELTSSGFSVQMSGGQTWDFSRK